MQQWEYKRLILARVNDIDKEMEILGNNGWELVAIDNYAGNFYLFKRPKNVTISTENYQSNSSSQSYTARKEWSMEELFPGIGK